MFGSIIFNLFYSWILYLRRTLFVISDSYPQTVIWSTLYGKALRVKEGTQSAFFLSSSREKKGAYPTNVVDLLVVACKPIILAGNQSCSQCHELVKCVTCQGSSLGVFSTGDLWIKATSLEQGPQFLWQRRSQILKDFHLLPESLYSHSFFCREMRWEQGQTTWKSGFFIVRCFCVYVCACFGTKTEYFWVESLSIGLLPTDF